MKRLLRSRGRACAAGLGALFLVATARPVTAELGRGRMIGVKIYEYSDSLPALFETWRSAGINTAFVSASLAARSEFMALAKKSGVATFIIFPVFFNAEELARRPDLYAVTDSGARAEEDWVKFVCPTRRDYLNEKTVELGRLIRDSDPDGISLDFVRTFVFWEMVYPKRRLDSLPKSCFDASCVEAFEKATAIALPTTLSSTRDKAGWILAHHLPEWTTWKCGVITRVVESLAREARRLKPGITVDVHTVPWRSADFGGAIRIVAGQDLSAIAHTVDFISPMCYHHMVKQTPAWIHSVVQDVNTRTGAAVIPSIQVKEAYIPGPESAAEFREALIEALKPPSRGVVFWNWAALAESPEKLAAVRDVVRGRG